MTNGVGKENETCTYLNAINVVQDPFFERPMTEESMLSWMCQQMWIIQSVNPHVAWGLYHNWKLYASILHLEHIDPFNLMDSFILGMI